MCVHLLYIFMGASCTFLRFSPLKRGSYPFTLALLIRAKTSEKKYQNKLYILQQYGSAHTPPVTVNTPFLRSKSIFFVLYQLSAPKTVKKKHFCTRKSRPKITCNFCTQKMGPNTATIYKTRTHHDPTKTKIYFKKKWNYMTATQRPHTLKSTRLHLFHTILVSLCTKLTNGRFADVKFGRAHTLYFQWISI